MARPDVKANPAGSPISGTTQEGTVAVATGVVDYAEGGWYGGVDDTSGYVIGVDSGTIGVVGRLDTTGNPVGSDTPTFWKSASKSDADLLKLINKLPGNTNKFNNISSAQAWLNASPYSIISGGSPPSPPPPPGPPPTPPPPPAGSGAWYFYSDEGTLNVGPPVGNGNAIFVSDSAGSIETFDPNKHVGESKNLFFDVKDSTGTDYTTQFNSLASGGTITISQNGDSATYTGNGVGIFIVVGGGGGNSYFFINTSIATQTKTSNAKFTYVDPISITFGS